MNTAPAEIQNNKCYLSFSFATLAVVAVVILFILPMLALIINFLQS